MGAQAEWSVAVAAFRVRKYADRSSRLTSAARGDAVSVSVSRSGDTDTNGAICGALLCAHEGREAIPRQWRNAVLSCRSV